MSRQNGVDSYWCGKACLVAGGSAGLGLSLAGALVRRGAAVVVCGRDVDRLDAAAHLLRQQHDGARILTVAADLTKDEDCRVASEQVLSELGGLDLLANCAGVSGRMRLLDADPTEFNRLWEINFLATVRLTRLLAKSLLQRNGHVVNIGSLASKVAPSFLGAYPATKFALAAYTQQLRMELGPQGLHALLVCPGPIARDDAGARYDTAASSLPDVAKQPGAGAKTKAIDPDWLAGKILRACERRRPELIVPAKARLLFGLGQIWPRLGDWLLRKTTGG